MALDNHMLHVGLDQRLSAYRSGGIARYALELGTALELVPDLRVTRIRRKGGAESSAGELVLRTPAHHRIEPLLIGTELALRRQSFDVYHATDFVAPRFMRCPVVVTVHDLAFLRWPNQLSRDALIYYRKVEKQRRRVAHWITPSEWTRSELMALVGIPERDISVIPHGVSSFVTRGDILPREQRAPYLLAVGTIEPRKRYELLLDAFERMKPRPELVVAGSPGWNTDQLQTRLRETEGVTWYEAASDAQINNLLSHATALVIPSLAEGFGLGALEAMARGTPVVSSGLGALSEVTGAAAHIPDQDVPSAWAGAIEAVIEDEMRWKELSERGASRAKKFSWTDTAKQTARVYRDVAG